MNQIDLITKKLNGEISATELVQLNDWLRENPENQAVYSKYESLWDSTHQSEIINQTPANDNWLLIRKKLAYREGVSRPMIRIDLFNLMKIFSHHKLQFRYIAVAGILFSLIFLSLFFHKDTILNKYEHVAVKNGQRKSVRLVDGSSITLNCGSLIKYQRSFTDSVREIWLSGEAFFKVAKDNRKFIVHTENAQITVPGTQFNVWAREHETRVIVKEGCVRLNAPDSDQNGIDITQGHASRIVNNGQPEKVIPVNTERLLGWLGDKLVFENTQLKTAVAEIERFFDVTIKLDPACASRIITAQFEHEPIEAVISSICLAFDLRYKFESGNFYLFE